MAMHALPQQHHSSARGALVSLRRAGTRCHAARWIAISWLALSWTASAHAVVVRGYVTDAYGKPLAGGQVRLVEGGKVVAIGFAGPDGAYELRSADAGRFTLLGSAEGYLPGIGVDFYAGATDVLQREMVLARDTVRQDITPDATGLATPLPQLSVPVAMIAGELLGQQTGVEDALRQVPGDFIVRSGGMGGVTSLYLRGGSATANLVTMDSMPADDVGGPFDFSTVSTTAIGRITVVRGPDSATYGTDAGAGVVAFETPRGSTLEPLFTYSGEAGSLYTYRNEVTGSGTFKRADYYGAFSRLQTSNDLLNNEFHVTTYAINAAYSFDGNTMLRVTARDATAATGTPGAYDFQHVTQLAKRGDQDLYATATLENRYKSDWHNLLRYGIARKREQETEFGSVGNYLATDPGRGGLPGYVGNVVTIQGANGYKATGQAQLYAGNRYDEGSNRDQIYYQSDYTLNRHFTGLFGFRFDNERGRYNDYDSAPPQAMTDHQQMERTNFEYNLQFQGEFFDRLFYSAGGALEKNHVYGIAGTPSVGLTYVPVRPRGHGFHGTLLRARYATGVQEPTLALDFASLYTELAFAGNAAAIAQYRIAQPSPQRSKTYDLGLDQNLAGDKLTMNVGYFHNVFDRQLESVPGTVLVQSFGFNIPAVNTAAFSAYVNSLAYRAQGAELEVVWHPKPHFLLRAGYTYLDTRVVQSFAADAVAANHGMPTVNPNLPGVAIGAYSPLVGARPFQRPPHAGYFDAEYTHKKLAVELKGALAGRSDDSTFLAGQDRNGGNTLLLPNRDLDFGYVKLDLGFSYALKHSFTYFAQLDNLLNDQRIGPIGYPGLPLTFRTGLKLRLGGD